MQKSIEIFQIIILSSVFFGYPTKKHIVEDITFQCRAEMDSYYVNLFRLPRKENDWQPFEGGGEPTVVGTPHFLMLLPFFIFNFLILKDDHVNRLNHEKCR